MAKKKIAEEGRKKSIKQYFLAVSPLLYHHIGSARKYFVSCGVFLSFFRGVLAEKKIKSNIIKLAEDFAKEIDWQRGRKKKC
jgi:hypothetical protein